MIKLKYNRIPVIISPNFVKFISFGFAGAITLYPFGVFLRDVNYVEYNDILNHESIHWEQQKELYCIPFYILYLLDWIISGFRYRKIRFEQEAYNNGINLDYLKTRKKFSWVRYKLW